MKYVLTAVVATLALTGTSCLPPIPVSDLAALATASLAEVVEGETVELQAAASNGAPPYLYRWSVEVSQSGGQELLGEPTSQTVQAGPLLVAGEYVFRLTVTDSQGFTDVDYVNIDVVEPDPGEVFEVSIDGVPLIPLGESETLEATTSYAGDVSFVWEVISGQGDLDPENEQATTVTPTEIGTLLVKVTMFDNAQDRSIDAQFEIDVVEPEVLRVEIDSPTTGVAEEEIGLSAETFGGSDDISYQWEIVDGEAALEDENTSQATLIADAAGEITITCTVTDNEDGEQATAQITIDITQANPVEPFTVEVGQPRLASPGEEVSAEVTVEGDPGELTYFWRDVTGDPIIVNATGENAQINLTSSLTTHIVAEVTATNEFGSTRTETDDLYISVIEDPDPVVVFEFEEFGIVRVQLDSENAPISVANFLSYVDEEFYNGLVIHRIEPGASFQVIQGGAFEPEAAPDYPSGDTMPTHDPIINEAEFGASNDRGTIAMARTSDPDSATSQFFFNVSDNSGSLDYNPQGNDGYAVFGTVLEGMDILDRMIEEVELSGSGGFHAVVNPLVMTSVARE